MTFRTVTLKEVSGGGTYGFIASASSLPSGQKFLRTTDIVSGAVDWNSVPYCAISASQIKKFRLNHEDIVISRTGANAGVNTLVLNPPENSVFAGYLVRFRIDKRLAEPKYVSYVLRSKVWKNFVEAHRTGSAQPQLNAQIMGSFEFKLPSLPVQRRVGQFLAAMDEKIQSNAQLSATLESLAQSIFKSWFIDFDPVHAKSLGEQPAGMDAETAALFPDSFEESKLGFIPAGWSVTSLTEISEFLNGLALQKFPSVDGEENLPVIKIPQLRTGIAEGAGWASSKIPSKYVVADGDILFSWSGALEVVLWTGGKGALNQHLFKVIPKAFPIWFSLHTTLTHLPGFREIAAGKATTMGHIQRGHLADAQFAVPSAVLLDKASEVLQPLLDASVAHRVQNRSLVKMRDSLLPRLISGELEIPEELLVD